MSRYKNYLSQSTAYKNKSIFVQLVARHLSKGHLKLLSNCFVFLLFGNKFVLESVNLLLELLDRFVSKFSSSLSLLQLRLTGSKLLGNLLIGGISSLGLISSILEFLFQLSDSLVIVSGFVLKGLLGWSDSQAASF